MGAVLVTGDFVVDFHIYEGRRKHYGDGQSPGVNIVRQPGGATLVHMLLEKLLAPPPPPKPKEGEEQSLPLVAQPPEWVSYQAVSEPAIASNGLAIDTSQHAYAFWRPFPRHGPPEKQYWRVSEAMGFGAIQASPSCAAWPPANKLPVNPEIIVLSEGGMGFRDENSCWQDLSFKSAKWIVLKTTSPVCEGNLWQTLSEKYSDKLIIVVSANELRKSAARITAGLSWEASVENLLCDLTGNLKPLLNCRHLIVAFESEGGIWLDLQPGRKDLSEGEVQFVYDAHTIEGDHAHDTEGTAFGFLSCLTAAVAWELTLSLDKPNLATALEGGLSAMRDLREKGHGSAGDEPKGFPSKRLAGVIKVPAHRYSKARFSCSGPLGSHGASGRPWTILQESQRQNDSYDELARLVVQHGPIALDNLPQFSVGNLLTVDRQEIESLRTISQLFRQYRDHDSGKKPLSLGVFGPPGAGKSFGVEALAAYIKAEKGWMVFNLSQFDTPKDLIGAFHQIRDRALSGELPVAFFDEFDAQKYRWLQYLLAPMQDGAFQEGQITHPIGKCILIFAGGTSWTFETFGPPAPTAGSEESENYRDFRLAKGPDFKSRLDGYLSVVGPNRRKLIAPKRSTPTDVQYVSGHPFIDDLEDREFPIRRALMIRGGFKEKPDQKLKIDEGVLHALLKVSNYIHGSRSLNKILQPLAVGLPGTVHRSHLAPRCQLNLHMDAEEFISLLDKAPQRPRPDKLSEVDVDVMAPAIHETWNRLGIREGWQSPTETELFANLNEFLKSSNRSAAEWMPRILSIVGLELRDGVADEVERKAIWQHLEYHLELLAAEEHVRWAQWHLDHGWRFGPEKDKVNHKHPCLVPYAQLKDVDKNKDRTQIRSYPEFAERAGKKIVFI